MRVLIGTTNPAKLKLFEQVLEGYPIEMVCLRDLGITAEPEEMGRNPAEKKPVAFDITNKKFTEKYFDILHHPFEKAGVDFC